MLLGEGQGSFKIPTASETFAVGTNPVGITSTNFNGDSHPDLAVTNLGSKNVSVLFGDGHAPGTSAGVGTFSVGDNPYGIESADFDNDGKPDRWRVRGIPYPRSCMSTRAQETVEKVS